MRAVVVLVVAGLIGPGVARAQTLPDGPLAVPGVASTLPKPAAAKPSKTAKLVHPKTAHHAKAPKSEATNAEAPARDVPIARRVTDDNPLSLGMKWNGSNDNASQTRVQNYGGDASGTGAAVGLKLHF